MEREAVRRSPKAKARNLSGPSGILSILPVEGSRCVVLGYDALGTLGQRLCLRKKVQTFHHFRIRFRSYLHALILTKSIYKDLSLDVGLDPVAVIDQVRLGIGNIGLVERLAEILKDGIVDLEALRGMMIYHVALGEIEEGVVLQKRVLKVIALDWRDHNIGLDAAATVNCAPAVGQLHFAIGIAAGLRIAIVIIIVKRNVAVVALDQPSAWSVIMSRGQSQPCVLRQRIHGLYQAFAKRDFTHDQSAIVVLNRSRDDLRCGRGQAVNQHDQRIVLAPVAVLRYVTLLCRSAAVMRNDELVFLQELVGHTHAFAQQAAGIAAQIKNQTLEIAKLIESLRDFLFRGLVEPGHVQVADARP